MRCDASLARASNVRDDMTRAFVVVLAFAFAFACAFPSLARARTVCFIASTLPWTFGAYQSQMLELSRAYASSDARAYWMPRASSARLKPGKYDNWREVLKAKTNVVAPRAEDERALAHLTYVGVPDDEFPGNDGMNHQNALTMRQLNSAAKAYGIDAYALLMDVGHLYLDGYDFDVPVVLWMPYHHEDLDSQGGVLRMFSAIAALAPSTGRAIEQAGALTRTVPHVISRAALNELADSFEARVLSGGGTLREGKERENAVRAAVFDSKAYDRSFGRDIDVVTADTFVVLMQGGNYEDADRKGWVSSIYAFAKFQRDHPDIKTHLWLHAIDSAMIESDLNVGSQPPVAVVRTGVALRLVLERSGIPSNMYTLDENKHDPAFTTALKRHADVCLHTSKAEGFGMVVLECQALGTPVVTTKYTAMRDYTKLGYAIEPAAYQSIQGAFFALVDVDEAAEALAKIATGTGALESLESTFAWIDSEFSLETVFSKFDSLLVEASKVHAKRHKWSDKDTFANRPLFTVVNDAYPRLASWNTPWTMYHHPSVKVNYEMIQKQMIALTTGSNYYGLAVAPTHGANGVLLPFDAKDSVHNINPKYVVLVPTWALRQVQERNSYIWSAAYSIMNSLRSQKYLLALPEGSARVERQRDEL